jgi:hypothetical protein
MNLRDLARALRPAPVFFCLPCLVSPPLCAQAVPGVTDKEILIGSCSALEGPSRALGAQTVKRGPKPF